MNGKMLSEALMRVVEAGRAADEHAKKLGQTQERERIETIIKRQHVWYNNELIDAIREGVS